MDPKQIKLKMASQLSEADKGYINEHPDQFSDEDRTAWSDVLGSSGTAPAAVPEEPGSGTPAPAASPTPPTPESGTAPGTTPDPSGGATPPTPTPAPAGFTFKNEDEAKNYVKKLFEEEKQKAIDAARTPEEKKWVEDNWKPKNWNEGIKTAAEAAADIIEQRQVLRAKQVEEHNKRVEADWQALRTEHKLKDIDDPEGVKTHDAIIAIGTKFGKKNFKEAYEVYMMVPVEQGGGWKPKEATPATPPADHPATPATPPVTPSEAASVLAKSKAQKAAAAKIGGKSPDTTAAGGSSPINVPTYNDIHTKSRNKLLKEALGK